MTHDEQLEQIIDERHATLRDPGESDKRDTLGRVIASFYEHDITDIGRTFLEALTAANAHSEAAFIEQYLVNQGFDVRTCILPNDPVQLPESICDDGTIAI